MNNPAPIQEAAGDSWSGSWSQWFNQVWTCLSGWKRTFNKTAIIDFPSIAANAQSSAVTVTVTGVRAGDAVLVASLIDTAGILYKGAVTANDTVSIYGCNFTAVAINPAATTFRIIIFQN